MRTRTSFRKNTWHGFAFVLMLCSIAHSCYAGFSGASITGSVVDTESGLPLEGVVVTATTKVEEGNLAGTNDGGILQVMDTVTDKAGKFYFPAWGQKSLPKKLNGVFVDQYVELSQPQLQFFKSGYEFNSVNNGFFDHYKTNVIRSDWDGMTIKLKPFKGSEHDYADRLSIAAPAWIDTDKECNWQKIPHMLAALFKQTQKFRDESINTYTFDIANIPKRVNCADPYIFLQPYLSEPISREPPARVEGRGPTGRGASGGASPVVPAKP